MDFRDPYAIVDDESLLPAERDSMLEAEEIVAYTEPKGLQWIYTRGVDLTAVRKLMFTAP